MSSRPAAFGILRGAWGWCLVWAFVLLSTQAVAKATIKDLDPTGPQPQVVLRDGAPPEPIYGASHALLISVANYRGASNGGWEPLPSTTREMDDLAAALRSHGFAVRRVNDPDAVELRTEIRRFVAQHGRRADHRLLIFFAGHGHTDPDTEMGYIVPVDASDPHRFSGDFYTKAMPITELNTLAHEIKARHALFLFDSCFSGTVFQSRSLDAPPANRRQYLRDVLDVPVRQMIAAGRANEKVPSRSTFTPLLIDLLTGRRRASDDAYLTGSDIGRWLTQNLPSFQPDQHPHSGFVPGRWDLGDMVFQVGPAASSSGHSAVALLPFRRFRDCHDGSCPWMRILPAGHFTMGSPESEVGRKADEGPQHEVTVVQPFAVMETEVTVGLFKVFLRLSGYKIDGGCQLWDGEGGVKHDPWRSWRKPLAAVDQADNHPVVCVNWNDAQTFADWMSRHTGQHYRLLTEAEWEYAARAGSQAAFSFGADADQICRHGNVADRSAKGTLLGAAISSIAACDDGHAYTAPVGSFEPNAFGLYDLHGNAWEWVQDCRHDYTAPVRTAGAVESMNCAERLLRGGGWISHPRVVRSAARLYVEPSSRYVGAGFRLARVLPKGS